MSETCPWCGDPEHEPIKGEPGSIFAMVSFRACPKLPDNALYEDIAFAKGPPGRLFIFEDDEN